MKKKKKDKGKVKLSFGDDEEGDADDTPAPKKKQKKEDEDAEEGELVSFLALDNMNRAHPPMDDICQRHRRRGNSAKIRLSIRTFSPTECERKPNAKSETSSARNGSRCRKT